MDVARRLGIHFGDVRCQRLDEGDREVAGPGRGVRQRGEVERFGPAGHRDRAGCIGRNHPERGLGPRQSRLEIQHVLQACAHRRMTARIAALDSMGASRGERDVLICARPNHYRLPLPMRPVRVCLCCMCE